VGGWRGGGRFKKIEGELQQPEHAAKFSRAVCESLWFSHTAKGLR
jgi:hypothetical protein